MMWHTLVDDLAREFPPLRSQIQDLRAEWRPEQIPQFLLVETLFVPYLKEMAVAGSEHRAARHAFEVVEDMVHSADSRMQSLAVVGIIENLELDEDVLRASWELMGSGCRSVLPTGEWIAAHKHGWDAGISVKLES